LPQTRPGGPQRPRQPLPGPSRTRYRPRRWQIARNIALGAGCAAQKDGRLINGFGPTEGTTFACFSVTGQNDLYDSVPIGHPISNTRTYVLGGAMRLLLGGTAPAIAAKAASTTIPIVFTVPEDPVKLGLVSSLSRPEGNLTGINLFLGELAAKRLELLRELVPAIRRVAAFVNTANPTRAEFHGKEMESAARAMGLQIQILNVGSSGEINAAFTAFERERPDALLIGPDPFFVARRVHLATLAARHAIPSSFSVRDYPEAGGMSYGTSAVDAYRQAGVYTGRILKGAKPADLPVSQASKFELVINVHQHLGLAEVHGLAGLGELFDTLVVFENYPVSDVWRTIARRCSTTGEPLGIKS
jgi:hypothetical protein